MMPTNAADPELEEIRKVVLQTYGAWNSRNTDNASPYFRGAPEDMFFDYWPLRFDDWQTYKNGAQAYLNTLSIQKITEKHMRVQRLGNVAWASTTYDVDPVSTEGEEFHVVDGRHTSILLKIDGAWKVCHEHWSPRAPQELAIMSPGVFGLRTTKVTPRRSAILAVTDEIFGAWNQLDLEKSARLYRNDADDSFFHLFSGKLDAWEEFALGVRKFLSLRKSLSIKSEDARVFEAEDVAWVATTWEMKEVLQQNGRKVRREGRYTGVLILLDGEWKVVHEHWSVPVRAAGWENY